MNDISKHALAHRWRAALWSAWLAAMVAVSLTTEPAHAEDEQTFSSHAAQVTGPAFTPDGQRVISKSLRDDRIARVVGDGRNEIGSSIGRIMGAHSHAVGISPDGQQIAVAGFPRASVIDAEGGKELWSLDILLGEYSPPYLMALVYSPDGKQLATSGASSKVGGRHGYKGGLITIRDAKSGEEEVRRFDILSFAAECFSFSPDGGSITVAGSDRSVRIRDTQSGERALSLEVAGPKINVMIFSPDDNRLVTGGGDFLRSDEIRLWNLTERLDEHR